MGRTASEVGIIDSLETIINPAVKDSQLSQLNNLVAYDSSDSNIVYCGRASMGASKNEPVWQIIRYDDSVDEISKYAGTGIYDQIWDNRESLTYN